METSEGQANSAGDCGEMAGFDESMLGLNDVTGSVFGSPEDFILAESEMKVSNEVAPRFYDDWKAIFPQLTILLDNIQVIQEEIANVGRWIPWPEEHFAMTDSNTRDWTVFPFLHTFPAYELDKLSWVQSTSAVCPKTVELLRQVKDIRTALFSKLGAGTELSTHVGWGDLSNYVLRCHIPLIVPKDDVCGVSVEEEVRHHQLGNILIFDDSKRHYAFNRSICEERIVLIVDIMRPSNIPLGTALGGHTTELDNFIDKFK